jgi:hypothetical protein
MGNEFVFQMSSSAPLTAVLDNLPSALEAFMCLTGSYNVEWQRGQHLGIQQEQVFIP